MMTGLCVRFFLCLAFVSVPALSQGQPTSGAATTQLPKDTMGIGFRSLQLRYRFHAGDTLRYRRTADYIDSGRGDGGVQLAEVLMTVTSVDSGGNATIVVARTRSESAKRSILKRESALRPNVPYQPPVVRVVVSPWGEFVDGEIVTDSRQRLKWKEEARREGRDDPMPDSSEVRSMVKTWFVRLPVHEAVRSGSAWMDTVDEYRVQTLITLKEMGPPVPSSGIGKPSIPAGSQIPHIVMERTISSYKIAGIVEHDGVRCVEVVRTWFQQYDKRKPGEGIGGRNRMWFRVDDGALIEEQSDVASAYRSGQWGTHWDIRQEWLR